MRIGIGYDIHRFNGSTRRGGGARALKLGGIVVPFGRALAGHSDADVLLHAIADALFGAIGAPDIGEQFSPSDPTFKGADSRLFIRRALGQVRRAGFTIANVDSTVIANAPKLGPYKRRMAMAIGRMLAIPATRVSVKAKTTEGLAPGTAGIAAQAVVLLLPARPSPARQKRG